MAPPPLRVVGAVAFGPPAIAARAASPLGRFELCDTVGVLDGCGDLAYAKASVKVVPRALTGVGTAL